VQERHYWVMHLMEGPGAEIENIEAILTDHSEECFYLRSIAMATCMTHHGVASHVQAHAGIWLCACYHFEQPITKF